MPSDLPTDLVELALLGGVFSALVLTHFIADWVLQSHDEAMRKPTAE